MSKMTSVGKISIDCSGDHVAVSLSEKEMDRERVLT